MLDSDDGFDFTLEVDNATRIKEGMIIEGLTGESEAFIVVACALWDTQFPLFPGIEQARNEKFYQDFLKKEIECSTPVKCG